MQTAPLFPYQPKVGQWFSAGAQHAIAIGQFASWLASAAPQAHAAVKAKAPVLLDGGRVAASGALTARGGLGGMRFSGSRLAGLGSDYTVDPVTGDVSATPSVSPSASPASPVTAWGDQILTIAKGVLGVKQANDLVKINIARAEAGLSPIDQSGIAPQVNVGLSAQTQKLVIGGALALGALMLFKTVMGRR